MPSPPRSTGLKDVCFQAMQGQEGRSVGKNWDEKLGNLAEVAMQGGCPLAGMWQNCQLMPRSLPVLAPALLWPHVITGTCVAQRVQ